jgi:hypothetical protein
LHGRTPPAKRCGGVTRAASFQSVHHLVLIDIGDGAWQVVGKSRAADLFQIRDWMGL